MKTDFLCSTALFALVLAATGAQTPAAPTSDSAPRTRGSWRAPVVSPDIQSDRRVIFRLRASNATKVAIQGQWPNGGAAMERDGDGTWSVTVGPIEPGVWEYSFQVDGLTMIDPGNPAIKPMRQPRTSILHVRGDPPLLHDFQDVPHGVVHQHTYYSKSLDRVRELAVYTPPGYHRHPDRRYPMLCLQHGMGDTHATWTAHGKAHWILDNLIAQGRAKPMVLLMMDGHAAPPGAGAAGFSSNTQAFERDLINDVLPFVEATYRVEQAADRRAIAGLSMGGSQSLTIGLNHTDLFAWVGGFSAAVPSRDDIPGVCDDPEAANRKLKLLWIACGKDDFLRQRNEEFIALLQEKNLRHEWALTEGNHSWPVWRRYLAEFASKLFQ